MASAATSDPIRVSAEWARAAVVAAQDIPDPKGTATYTSPADVLEGIGLIQLDPLTRVSTAQRLTCLTRLPGKHRSDDVDPSLWPQGESISFEAFTKVACLFPLQDWPLLQLNRESLRRRHGHKLDPAATQQIRKLVAAHPGGAATGEIEAEFGPERTVGWTWSQVKKTTELMVRMGELVITARRGVVRLFDLPERALPADLLEAERMPAGDLLAGLARRAAGSLAVMTVADFAHHYNLSSQGAAAGIEAATLVPLQVAGWRDTGYALPDTMEAELESGGRAEAGLGPVGQARLIGPFDPLLRDRRRALRIFGFDYTFEAYVPKAKRVYGHYVMAVLSGTELIGRVDLWRSGGELVVNRIFPEPGIPSRSVTARAKAAATTLSRQLSTSLRLPETAVHETS